MPLQLREYQHDAVCSISTYFEEKQGNPLVVIPTGGGKSIIISEFIRKTIEDWPETRIVVVTHVKELIAQNFQELISYWPEAPAGVYSAGLNMKQIHAQVLFCGIQSVHRRAYDLQRVDLILVDEAHLIPRNSNTTYRKFLDDLKSINPYVKVVGFTATPFRLDFGLLHTGDEAIFSDVAYDINIRDLIAAGYLSPPITQPGLTQIDTIGVGTSGGDFIVGQLEAKADDPETIKHIADEICNAGQERRGWLTFGVSKKHTEDLHEAIKERGFSSACVFGDTPGPQRDATIAAFKRQEFRNLASLGVLTTGFNAKHVDLIGCARPTKSTGLWVQIVGRGTRLYPGKTDCLVLDFGGNIARHGPIDDPFVKDKKRRGGVQEAPTKSCPECKNSCHATALVCPKCAYEFPPPETKISTQASQLDIISGAPKTEWLDVSSIYYNRHAGKDGKPDTVCVTYMCGSQAHREWVCPEHKGFARNKFVAWWMKRCPEFGAPETVQEALDAEQFIDKPIQIAVRPLGRYTEIIGVRFDQEDA